MSFTFYHQLTKMDCGPTCLRMVAKYYGKYYSAETLGQKSTFSYTGVTLLGLSETAEEIGFITKAVQISFKKLVSIPLPAILHWDQRHFVVLVSISNYKIIIADPAKGLIAYNKNEFELFWISDQIVELDRVGKALLLEPTSDFYKNEGEQEHIT